MTEPEPFVHLVVFDGEAPSTLPPQVQLRPKQQYPNPIHEPHPLWVEEAAFVCWMRSERIISAALCLLEQEWEVFAPQGSDGCTIPSVHTFRSWRRRHDWDAKADQIIATHFPTIRMQQIARLVAAGGAALDFLIGSARGEFDHLHPGTHEARRRSSEVLLVAGGLGTYGSRDRVAPVVKAVVEKDIDYQDKTEQELARITIERIRATKTNHDERRR